MTPLPPQSPILWFRFHLQCSRPRQILSVLPPSMHFHLPRGGGGGLFCLLSHSVNAQRCHTGTGQDRTVQDCTGLYDLCLTCMSLSPFLGPRPVAVRLFALFVRTPCSVLRAKVRVLGRTLAFFLLSHGTSCVLLASWTDTRVGPGLSWSTHDNDLLLYSVLRTSDKSCPRQRKDGGSEKIQNDWQNPRACRGGCHHKHFMVAESMQARWMGVGGRTVEKHTCQRSGM